MGTKTISLADDAYERLRAEKREGESFSDVVRRLTRGVALDDYFGVLDAETADELERNVAERRAAQTASHRSRVEEIGDDLGS